MKMENWRAELAALKYNDIEATAPEFFAASGGRTMKLKPFNDKTANGLTRCIIEWIKLHMGDANRINSTGIVREIGGRSKWVPTSTRKGTADIHAIINGRHVSIEIKIGRDRISEDQRRERDRITRAGGLYYVASTMAGFVEWYKQTFGPIPCQP